LSCSSNTTCSYIGDKVSPQSVIIYDQFSQICVVTRSVDSKQSQQL
jgi:hypothetical protein